jgi:alkylation response protein AidB-like acyl-CoA dehydrogenase
VTKEYQIERKFREARLYISTPVTNKMVLNYIGAQVLGLPRSY